MEDVAEKNKNKIIITITMMMTTQSYVNNRK